MKNGKENLNLNFYEQNSDFRSRVIVADKENSIFAKDASVRIWYNKETMDYLPHWHDAMEVIIPIENYYDVTVDNESHHIMPGEIFMISPRKMHHLIAPDTLRRRLMPPFTARYMIFSHRFGANTSRIQSFMSYQSMLT